MPRPRVFPPEVTDADRIRAYDQALREAGGKRLTVRLSPDVVAAIALARAVFGDKADVDVIERAVLREGARARRAQR